MNVPATPPDDRATGTVVTKRNPAALERKDTVQARDIAMKPPMVTIDDRVTKAFQIMALNRMPGLFVVDEAGRPKAVLSGTDVLRLAVPRAYHEDPSLTRIVDEAYADAFSHDLGDLSVGDCLPRPLVKPVTVPLDATLLEVAAMMLQSRNPLVAVVTPDGRLAGAITLERLLTSLALFTPGT